MNSFFKNTIAIVALLTIGSINTKQIGQKTTPQVITRPVPKPTKNISTAPQTFRLDEFNYLSASVLPMYTHNNKKYVILTREARGYPQKEGGKKYTYDDFSGARDEGEDNVLVSAAREFHEEGILEAALGWSLEDTIRYVKSNIIDIIAYEAPQQTPNSKPIRNVTYIVQFNEYKKLFDTFYAALEREKARHKKLGTKPNDQVTTEKDIIAAVLWDDLKQGTFAKVDALIRDSKKNSFHKEQITLRPFLTMKLRSFILNKPYERGEFDKIKYYHQQ
jgi:hypothetical protein